MPSVQEMILLLRFFWFIVCSVPVAGQPNKGFLSASGSCAAPNPIGGTNTWQLCYWASNFTVVGTSEVQGKNSPCADGSDPSCAPNILPTVIEECKKQEKLPAMYKQDIKCYGGGMVAFPGGNNPCMIHQAWGNWAKDDGTCTGDHYGDLGKDGFVERSKKWYAAHKTCTDDHSTNNCFITLPDPANPSETVTAVMSIGHGVLAGTCGSVALMRYPIDDGTGYKYLVNFQQGMRSWSLEMQGDSVKYFAPKNTGSTNCEVPEIVEIPWGVAEKALATATTNAPEMQLSRPAILSVSQSGSPSPSPLKSGPIYSTYINTMAWYPTKKLLASLGVPGYAQENPYNVINYAFWLSSTGATDVAKGWENILHYCTDACESEGLCFNTSEQMRAAMKKEFHKAGKQLVLSAFGGTDNPTTDKKDPTTTCDKLADYAINMSYDGVDLDWEDSAAMQAGTGEEWLISCIKAIRKKMPKGKYLLTSAPQAPYFIGKSTYPKGGYLTIHKEVGDQIDFYNVQFYNQMDTSYDTYEKLFVNSGGTSPGTAVDEIHKNGVEMEKLVVGKPILKSDVANTGLMPAKDLEAAFAKAGTELNWETGVMTWQYASDAKNGFSFVSTVAEAF